MICNEGECWCHTESVRERAIVVHLPKGTSRGYALGEMHEGRPIIGIDHKCETLMLCRTAAEAERLGLDWRPAEGA